VDHVKEYRFPEKEEDEEGEGEKGDGDVSDSSSSSEDPEERRRRKMKKEKKAKEREAKSIELMRLAFSQDPEVKARLLEEELRKKEKKARKEQKKAEKAAKKALKKEQRVAAGTGHDDRYGYNEEKKYSPVSSPPRRSAGNDDEPYIKREEGLEDDTDAAEFRKRKRDESGVSDAPESTIHLMSALVPNAV
jgi:hypothetical protein